MRILIEFFPIIHTISILFSLFRTRVSCRFTLTGCVFFISITRSDYDARLYGCMYKCINVKVVQRFLYQTNPCVILYTMGISLLKLFNYNPIEWNLSNKRTNANERTVSEKPKCNLFRVSSHFSLQGALFIFSAGSLLLCL